MSFKIDLKLVWDILTMTFLGSINVVFGIFFLSYEYLTCRFHQMVQIILWMSLSHLSLQTCLIRKIIIYFPMLKKVQILAKPKSWSRISAQYHQSPTALILSNQTKKVNSSKIARDIQGWSSLWKSHNALLYLVFYGKYIL